MNTTIKYFLALFAMCLGFMKSKAAVITDTARAADQTTCLMPGVLRMQFSVSSTGTTGAYLDIKLPSGFTYAGLAYGPIVTGGSGANTLTYAGMVAGRHRFNFGSSVANQTIRFGIRQLATCAAGSGSYTGQDSLFFFEGAGSTFNSVSNIFNLTSPDLSITSITNNPSPTNPFTNVQRQYTVTNGGLGATRTFILAERFNVGDLAFDNTSFRINPAGVNFTIPAANITIKTDSILVRIDSALCTQIGNNNSFFENGESFVLRYTVVPQNCGVSNSISSTLLATWACPNTTRCQWSSQSTSISISVPAAPVLNITSTGVGGNNRVCFDGTTRYYDTIRIINTGGTATRLDIDISHTTGRSSSNVISFQPPSWNYLDTSGVFVRINDNGTNFKPSFSNIANQTAFTGYTYAWAGKVARFRVQVPSLANADTIYIYVPSIYHNFSSNCNENLTDNTQSFTTAVAYLVNYRNACGDISYFTPEASVVNTGLAFQSLNYSADMPVNIACNQNYDARYIFNGLNIHWTGKFQRSSYQLIVDTGNLSNWNRSIPLLQRVFFTNGAGNVIVYPYKFVNGAYFFSGSAIVGFGATSAMIFKLRTTSNGSTCAGTATVGFSWLFNADSSNCTTYNLVECNRVTFSFAGCVVCCTDGGVNFHALKVERTNFGLLDANNDRIADAGNTRADSTQIRRDKTILGDTIRLSYAGTIVTNGTNPQWESLFANAVLKNGTAGYSHISSTARVRFASGGDTVFNITPTNIADTFTWNMSAVRTLLNGDSVFLTARYRVLNNTDYNEIYSANFFASRIANPSLAYTGNYRGNNRFMCGIQFYRIINSLSGITFNPASDINFSPCQQVGYTHVIQHTSSQFYNFIDNFPNEVRPIGNAEEITFTVPSGYVIDSFNVLYRYASGAFSSDITLRNASLAPTLSGNVYTINMQNLFQGFGGSLPIADQTYWIFLFTYIRPISCVVPHNTPQTSIIAARLRSPNVSTAFTATMGIPRVFTSQPIYVLNSTTPTAAAFDKVVSWPLSITNAGATASPNNWLRFTSPSGNLTIDSVKLGSTLFTPDVNGFYRLGTLAASSVSNLTVYSTNNACTRDSINVYIGYQCNGYPTTFSTTLCSYAPIKFYVNPQPAAIQTAVTPLSSTPRDPSNASSAAYGSSSVNMCGSFPVQMEIQSTQTANIFNVRERIVLPTNSAGQVGLSYVSDSGYIEYPIGSTPRAFSTAANSALLVQAGFGQMTLDLAQIDPTNFSSTRGLLGTGLGANSTRRAIIRFKLRTNCNFVSGSSWRAVQLANSPCGAPATGNNAPVNGTSASINGITVPYLADVNMVLAGSSIVGFGTNLPVSIKSEKIGAVVPTAADSFTMVVPTSVNISTINCAGSFCPASTVSPVITQVGANRVYKWRYPATASNSGDTLRYTFNLTSATRSVCAANLQIRLDLLQRATVYCGAAIPANVCPNSSVSLGGDAETFNLEKPNLTITDIQAGYPNIAPRYTYTFSAGVRNTGTAALPANSRYNLRVYFDANNNNILEPSTDILVHRTVFNTALAINANDRLGDTFSYSGVVPSASRAMFGLFTVADTPNCTCDSLLVSQPIIGLNAEPRNYKISTKACTNTIEWSVVNEYNVNYYTIEMNENNVWTEVGKVYSASRQAHNANYSFVHNATEGKKFYRILVFAIGQQVSTKSYKEKLVENNCGTLRAKVAIMPNPAHTQFEYTIYNSTDLNNQSISIYSANGKLMLQTTTNELTGKINITGFKPGVYMVQFKNSEFAEVVQLLVE